LGENLPDLVTLAGQELMMMISRLSKGEVKVGLEGPLSFDGISYSGASAL
jgi:hypothetical protein